MSLLGRTIERTATLPDGRSVTVHVGVPDDPYIPRAQLDTVDVELHSGGHVLAAVNTVLDPDQESEAEQLAREIARKLESGEIEPTAHAIEPLADTLR
jgi:nucleotide-binding universal stress UspA family protein